jgi:hypothetical protein
MSAYPFCLLPALLPVSPTEDHARDPVLDTLPPYERSSGE